MIQGAKDGFIVTLGQGVTNLVAAKIPFGQTSTVGKGAMQLLIGTAGAMVVKKVLKSERAAAFYLAGAYSNVIKQALSGVPVLGPALAGVGVYPQLGRVGVYPRALSAWPAADQNAIGNGLSDNREIVAQREDAFEEVMM